MTRRVLKGLGLMGGSKKGEALISKKAFTFAHGVDPGTGKVTDVRSDIKGSGVKARVLFYPFGKGSTTASAWFLETVRLNNEPAGIVTEVVDLSAVIGSVMAKLVYGKEIPVVSGIPMESYASIASGSEIEVNADAGEVLVL